MYKYVRIVHTYHITMTCEVDDVCMYVCKYMICTCTFETEKREIARLAISNDYV